MGSRSRPGVLATIWNNFARSLGARKPVRTIVGKDDFGNVYYVLEPNPDGPVQTRNLGSNSRGYLPGPQASINDLPVEWEAWLRHRRQSPPTTDEIATNQLHALRRASATNAVPHPHHPNNPQVPLLHASPPPPINPSKDFPKRPEFEEGPGTYRQDDPRQRD